MVWFTVELSDKPGSLAKMATTLGDKGIKEGIRAKVSSFTRMHVNVSMVRGKITGQYVNSILAKREAVLAYQSQFVVNQKNRWPGPRSWCSASVFWCSTVMPP